MHDTTTWAAFGGNEAGRWQAKGKLAMWSERDKAKGVWGAAAASVLAASGALLWWQPPPWLCVVVLMSTVASAGGGAIFYCLAIMRRWANEAEQAVQLRMCGDLVAEVPDPPLAGLQGLVDVGNAFLIGTASANFEYKRTLERIADGVITLDVNTLRIASVNQSGVKLLGGRDAGELVGELYSRFVPDPKQAELVVQTGSQEYDVVLLDGSRAVFASQASLIGEGEFATALLVFRNITVQREFESALADARDAAIEAARMKAEFLANMSHEIRTPMNGILGMTELLLHTPLSADQLDLTRTISNSADSLLRIINDILDFSKIEAGKLTIERANLDFLNLLEDLRALLSVKAAERSVEFVFDWARVPRFVLGDPVRLRQILLNLLSNAIKFTEKGQVRLTIEPLGDANETLRFVVTDTGIGMSPEQCAKVFEKFVQGDSSTTRRFGGTGLGLSITRQLVELMGGTIEVESELGVGSSFIVQLSLPRASEPVQSVPVPGKEVAPGMRVLLVEDNLVNQKVAARFLGKLGCAISIASNGKEAVEMIERETFDIVFMDCQMPTMDGYEATRAIRQLTTPARSVHIVAMTANAMVGDRERCLDAGMDDYITKPVRLPVLRQALEVAAGYRPRSQPSRSLNA